MAEEEGFKKAGELMPFCCFKVLASENEGYESSGGAEHVYREYLSIYKKMADAVLDCKRRRGKNWFGGEI